MLVSAVEKSFAWKQQAIKFKEAINFETEKPAQRLMQLYMSSSYEA